MQYIGLLCGNEIRSFKIIEPVYAKDMDNCTIVSHTDLLLHDETNEVSTRKPRHI